MLLKLPDPTPIDRQVKLTSASLEVGDNLIAGGSRLSLPLNDFLKTAAPKSLD